MVFLLLWALLVPQAVAAQDGWKRITPIERGRQAMTTDAQPTPSRAMRMIFEYDGDRIRFVLQTPVDIATSTLASAGPEQQGVFVEVRDAASRTLARIPAPQALATSLEAFPERHDQPITRSDVAHPTGAFTVIVPVASTADHVTIVRTTLTSADGRATELKTVDLVSFPLTPTDPR